MSEFEKYVTAASAPYRNQAADLLIETAVHLKTGRLRLADEKKGDAEQQLALVQSVEQVIPEIFELLSKKGIDPTEFFKSIGRVLLDEDKEGSLTGKASDEQKGQDISPSTQKTDETLEYPDALSSIEPYRIPSTPTPEVDEKPSVDKPAKQMGWFGEEGDVTIGGLTRKLRGRLFEVARYIQEREGETCTLVDIAKTVLGRNDEQAINNLKTNIFPKLSWHYGDKLQKVKEGVRLVGIIAVVSETVGTGTHDTSKSDFNGIKEEDLKFDPDEDDEFGAEDTPRL